MITKRQFKKAYLDLKLCHDIQSHPGNKSYNEYMCGFYNGLELALALVEERSPDYEELSPRIPDSEEWVERAYHEHCQEKGFDTGGLSLWCASWRKKENLK